VDAFSTARDAKDRFSSTPYQTLLTDFIREGHFARHIRRMRMLYKQRELHWSKRSTNQWVTQLDVIGAEAGTYLVELLPPVRRRPAKTRITARKRQ
jgi:GntR family transcriptional regulator / MocR family aminotransferase